MKKIYLYFHVGRGGRFNNAGHKTFVDFQTIQDVLRSDNNVFHDTEDEEGNELPVDKWQIRHNDSVLFDGQEAYDIINGIQEHGVAEYDGEYDTAIVRELHDLREDELEIIGNMIINDDYLPWCDGKDEVVRYVAANSSAVRDKYLLSVVTFNSDPYMIETDEQIADVALSAFNDSLEEVDEDDEEEWADALAKLDLESATQIYRNKEMLIAFDGDF